MPSSRGTASSLETSHSAWPSWSRTTSQTCLVLSLVDLRLRTHSVPTTLCALGLSVRSHAPGGPARTRRDSERRFRYLLAPSRWPAVGRVLYIVRMRSSPMPTVCTTTIVHWRSPWGRGCEPSDSAGPGDGHAPPDSNPPAWSLGWPEHPGWLRSVLSHQLVAAVVGTATVLMLAGRTRSTRRAALIAAALIAFYPNASPR